MNLQSKKNNGFCKQLSLFPEKKTKKAGSENGKANKIAYNDRKIHDWYRFVLSFPPHLVRDYIQKFGLKEGDTILDPFCGTGTTIVEAKLCGINSIGIESNPVAYFASSVKIDWDINPSKLKEHAIQIEKKANKKISEEGGSILRMLPEESYSLLLTNSISAIPLHKSLILIDILRSETQHQCCRHEMLALAKALVYSISNLHFGPEVGVHRIKKIDAPVIESWLAEVSAMASDINYIHHNNAHSIVHHADSRQINQLCSALKSESIDAVFTSPPYPNEKDYTRATRLESVLLGFIKNKTELRELKKKLLRSNTRNVYKGDDDDKWISDHEEIQAISAEIENRRIALGKTSGFEKLYGKVTKLYFGGMARHLSELRPFLKPGAYLGYVVGDQASYLQVMIRTGQLLAEIGQNLGYRVVSIDLFRTRLATATRKQLREEVVVFQWPGA